MTKTFWLTFFLRCAVYIYTVSQKKLCHYTFVHNFDKCWPIFKILSLLYSPRNLQQNLCHTAHHTIGVLLHYLAKDKRPKFQGHTVRGQGQGLDTWVQRPIEPFKIHHSYNRSYWKQWILQIENSTQSCVSAWMCGLHLFSKLCLLQLMQHQARACLSNLYIVSVLSLHAVESIGT